MENVCPLPDHWHRVFQKLSDAAVESDCDIPLPPTPLILAGWAYSNDLEKNERWKQTVAWAEKWGFTAIIEELASDMMHRVEHPRSYDIGPFGGPMHLSWNFEPKPVVSKEYAAHTVALLQADWEKIAGTELCKMTRPLRLTGAKKRRLVVYADPFERPLWGTWTQLTVGPERREFTRLRAAVNAVIHPLEIDHIEFVHDNRDQAR